MKRALVTPTQAVVLVVAVVGVVSVVTYTCTLIGNSPGKETGPPAPAGNPVQLDFPELTAQAQPAEGEETTDIECEWHVPNHYNFWFHNTAGAPVKVWSRVKSCKCTKVELASVPDSWKGLAKAELESRARVADLSWHELTQDSDPVTIGPDTDGVIRLTWEGKALGQERLSARIEMEANGVPGEAVTLEVPVLLVPALRVSPEEHVTGEPTPAEVAAGELRVGDARTVRMICWSATRKDFSLKVDHTSDPCIRCGPVERLSSKECQELSKQTHQHLLCAYRVAVTVQERTEDGEHELDLGPFLVQVVLSSDPGIDPLVVPVTGVVRGELTVGNPEDHDRVSLGSFERDDGATRQITLTAEQSNWNLQVAEKPDFLTVDLHEEKGVGVLGRMWTLTVKVPPQALSGPIPPHTTIVLQTTGGKGRRIRIPVTGNAYVK